MADTNLAPLLRDYGSLFSQELAIDLQSGRGEEVFRWFLASLLFGARISETVAKNTYRAFVRHRLLSAPAIVAAPFQELLQIMAEGGYVRYDGITSRKVKAVAEKLIASYGGDLNALHEQAKDAHDLMARLQQFKGVGPTTASIFLRELRGIWAKANPPLGHLARLAADHLRIADPIRFWEENKVAGYDLRHFEAFLTRIGKDFCRKGRCHRAPLPH